MENLNLILKGFIVGIAKIIPGVSGAMLAISLGIYEKAMFAISNFFKNTIENFKYLFLLGIGAVLAIVLASKLVIICLNNYYLPTMLLFIGLIVGGIPSLFKKIKTIKIKYIVLFILSFLFVFLLTFLSKMNLFSSLNTTTSKMFAYFVIGFIDALTMIIPGISGTAVMMILGCYELMLNLLSNLNIILFIPFILGVLTGIILLAKLLNYLFINHSELVYSSVLGFSLSSILFLLISIFKHKTNFFEIVISISLFIFGIIIAYKLE